MPSPRQFLRLAQQIHALYEKRALQFHQSQQALWRLLDANFDKVQRQRLKVKKALAHDWHLAAETHQKTLRSLLRSCTEVMSSLHDHGFAPEATLPSLAEVLDELHHLQTEFGKVVLDSEPYLSIETEPIVLKGIDLGRFAVQLHWQRLLQSAEVDCFEIVAIDPHPAASDEAVTHPHVKSNRLCPGSAETPLRKALQQGRFTDAFSLIGSVLRTYNAGSPHVSLSNWGGVSCGECGNSTDEEDRHYCDRCSHDVCGDCTAYCRHCDNVSCVSCQTYCSACNEPCCRSCLQTSACSEVRCCPKCLKVCSNCQDEVAPGELDDETSLCPICLNAQRRSLPNTAESALGSPLSSS